MTRDFTQYLTTLLLDEAKYDLKNYANWKQSPRFAKFFRSLESRIKELFCFLFIQNNMLNLIDVKFLSSFDCYAVNSGYKLSGFV